MRACFSTKIYSMFQLVPGKRLTNGFNIYLLNSATFCSYSSGVTIEGLFSTFSLVDGKSGATRELSFAWIDEVVCSSAYTAPVVIDANTSGTSNSGFYLLFLHKNTPFTFVVFILPYLRLQIHINLKWSSKHLELQKLH